MKKTVAILVSAVLLLLCSCGKDDDGSVTNPTEQQIHKSADMLNITNFEKTYLDCLSRYNAVISAVKNKVQILEKEHNKAIETQDPERFFLNENYILTYFEPFHMNSFSLTEGFEETLSQKEAEEYFSLYSGDADIRYDRVAEGTNILYFTSEDSVKKFCVEYDASGDSFRYTASTDNGIKETVEEMLEFAKADNNVYLIQSKTARCYVEFDGVGNIVYFVCSTLKDSAYTAADSIYDADVAADRNWAKLKSKDSYLNIHTFENGVMTHEECSSGPWKTVAINENDYASAFIF